MDDPRDRRLRGGSSLWREALRWMIAVPIATVVAVGLLFAMSRLVDGSWILEGLIRVFPLSQKELAPEERCGAGPARSAPAVTIEGSVGYMAGDRFAPLEDAEIRALHGLGGSRGVEVGADGHFRFAAALPGGAPGPCETPAAKAPPQPLLIIRAPGCAERRVPVTRAWVDRRILLSCAARG